MSDQSYITPTKERPVVPQTAGNANFPVIQGNRYEFVEVIGSGGGGTVFKAHDTVLNKPVAIKKLHASSTDDAAIRFQREARLIAALKHKNVMSALDFGLTPTNEPYLILDYVHGESLSQLIRRDGQMLVEQCLPIFIQLCCGLAHAHKNGVIHRDIKPSNVMLVQEADVQNSVVETIAKIVDFGLAKDVEESQFLTKTNVTLGTPIYMSPEQTRGHQVDRRTDIYSFGVLMFESLSGEPPFSSETQIELANMHLNEQAPSLESRGVECSPELESIIAKCLNKNPKDRFQSFELLQTSLQQELDAIQLKNSEPNSLGISSTETSIDSQFKEIKTSLMLVLYFLLAAVFIGGLLWLLLCHADVEPAGKLRHSADFGSALSSKGKVLPDKAKIDIYSKSANNDGSWIFLDASDKDVRKLLKSDSDITFLDVTETNLKKSTFDLMAKRASIDTLAYRSNPINADSMQNIARVKSLTDVRLGTTKQVDFKALSYLNTIPGLTQLELSDVALTEEAFDQFASLKSLESLDLSHCTGITARGLSKLAVSKRLINLKMPYSDVTDDGIKAIRGSRIKALWLCNCKELTNRCLEDVREIKSLAILDVTNDKNIKPDRLYIFHEKRPDVQIYNGETDPNKKKIDLGIDDN